MNLGARFTARFDLEETPAADSEAGSPPDAPAVPALRVLLVEDHADTRRCVTQLLQSQGYEVAVAGDMKSARALGARSRFDLLLTDVALPDGNGLELLKELQRNLAQPPWHRQQRLRRVRRM